MTNYGAIVRHPGNVALFDAVEISLLALAAGWPLHVHAEGVRGTGKTTVLRAARSLLPPLERIAGCPYNCRPDRPHCPLHRALPPEQLAALGRETVPRPFLEISHSAKLGTVVGSIDLGGLSRADGLQAALLPGTLPRAHRGVVIVDEINRLAETAPELADVLLDAMGTRPGRVQIEESGLPHVTVPVELVVWAASNPDEDPGPLSEVRRQLSDRFDMTVGLERPPGPEWVEQVLMLLDGHFDGRSMDRVRAAAQAHESVAVSGDMRSVCVPEAVRRTIADLYSRFTFESLRAAEGLFVAARAAAARAGRREVTIGDVRRAAPLVLRHRLEPDRLQRCLQHLDDLAAKPKPRASGAMQERAAAEPARERAAASDLAAGAGALPLPPAAAHGSPPPAQAAPARPHDPPLLQRFWERLSGQTPRNAASGQPAGSGHGHATAPSHAHTTASGAATAAVPGHASGLAHEAGSDAAAAVRPGGSPAALAPPNPARPLRQLPPDHWLKRPEQLSRSR